MKVIDATQRNTRKTKDGTMSARERELAVSVGNEVYQALRNASDFPELASYFNNEVSAAINILLEVAVRMTNHFEADPEGIQQLLKDMFEHSKD